MIRQALTNTYLIRASFLFFLSIFSSNLIGQDIVSDSIIIRNFNSADFKISPSSFDVIEDENGIIYIANETGVLEYDGSTWRLIPIRGYKTAYVLKKGANGNIYVGGENEFGFLKRDSVGDLQYQSLRSQFNDSLDVKDVWQIIEFENSVYFQSYSGLYKYDGENTKRIKIEDTWVLVVNNEFIYSTFNKGIGRIINDSLVYVDKSFLDPEDAPFKLLPFEGRKKIALTEEHGLYTMDTVTFKMEKWEVSSNEVFSTKGLYDGMVWDDSTYLLASTRGGVFWINRKGDVVRKITTEEGLQSNYMGEFLKSSTGNMWLPSVGLTHIIFPDKQSTSNFNTLIRKTTVNDSSYYCNTNNGNFNIPAYGPVGSVTFHFATPGFDKADLEYSYYLEGFDNKWSGWTENIKKEYTNLSSGVYTFNVKARLHDGTLSTQALIKIDIPSLWYRTQGAYVIAVFFVILIIWAGASYRAAKLKMINVQLEQVVHERTIELVTQKEELVLANTELDHFVYRSSHDLIAPLKSLKGLISITRTEVSEDYRQEYFQLMENSVVKLEEFIKSILEYSSNAKEGITKELIDLNDIIDNIVEDLKYFDRAEKVTLHRKIDSTIQLKSDPKRLKIVLSNLIANAVKYHNYQQESPFINISFQSINDKVIIKVEDNGQGIEPQYLKTIFDMFVRASDTSEGSGLGLYIVKDTISNLGAEIDVHSDFGKGTTFTVSFNEENELE